ncbi:MAG TPA: c-type cytochrome [Bryobacteraceae bacterium]|nr:c-type cytochrome [Bryobacteraceae bacterium]
MSIDRITALLLVTALGACAQSGNLEKGRQLFLGMCSRCHGVTGAGGEGPNLNRPVLSQAPDDDALRAVIRDGIPDRGMPRIRRFTDAELDAMVAFVRSLGHSSGASASGNAQQGKAVYQRLGCSSCHTIAGDGGTLGPELTDIGAHRAPDYLRQAIVDPAATLPRGVMPVPARGFSEFLPVHVVTRGGQEVRGVRVNEDSFTIQVRDTAGRLYSFRKTDLQQLDKEMGKSLMPDYKNRVSGADLDDLIAYLSGLEGAK